MAVLTIYNHGSGGWSGKSASKLEIVNLFGNAHATAVAGGVRPFHLDGGMPFVITEGVGGKGDPHQHDIVFDAASNQLTETRRSSGRRIFRRERENAAGLGVQENVANIKQIVKYLIANNRTPTAINMIGWSRGAVTCFRAASELWRDATVGASTIPINIFAVDPVAGDSADKADVDPLATQGSVLYPNVRFMVATLALNENRKTFSPKTQAKMQVADPNRTQSVFLHFPGVHSDVAKWSSEPGFVVFDLCARFLYNFGTIVPEHAHFLMTADRLVQCYFNMALGNKNTGLIVSKQKRGKTKIGRSSWKDRQKGLKQKLIGKGFGDRGLAVDQVSGDGEDALVNVHHELLFKRHYRQLYDVCFNSNLPPMEWQMAMSAPAITQQLDRLDLLSPGAANLLARANRSVTRADEAAWAGALNGASLVP